MTLVLLLVIIGLQSAALWCLYRAPASAEPSPMPQADVPSASPLTHDALTLLLCSRDGVERHEMTIHAPEAPVQVSYAGVRWALQRAQGDAWLYYPEAS